MPVEIRELIIRAKVVGDRNDRQTASTEIDRERSELIAACVEQVLKILERRRER